MNTHVIVYTTEDCNYCRAAKALLTSRNIPFEEKFIPEADETGWQALVKKSGMRTFPQIFAGETLVGGFSDLEALDKKDKLASLVSEIP